jgi:hypothetical protein
MEGRLRLECRSMSRMALCLALLGFASCGSDGSLGPPDSFRVLVPTKDVVTSKGGLPVVKTLGLEDPTSQILTRLFEEGFASEMLRTAYLAKQLVRDGQLGGRPASPEGRAIASEGLPVLVGAAKDPYGRGLAVDRLLRAPLDHPEVPWLGLPADLERDSALVQTVSGKLATYTLHLALTGGTFSQPSALLPTALGDGYRMAMEVVAREWRVGKGPQGVVPYDAGTPMQRRLFADVRENRFVTGADRRTLRSPGELLADPGVAATVLYRMAQARTIAGKMAPAQFYQPFAGRLPPGVSPAAVLGPFRNFQAKLLGAWADAAQRGHPPQDIAGLLEVYAAAFPAEKAEALRIFVVTTFAATVAPGGVSTRPEDATKALAAIDALVTDVAAGRRSLRAAAR